MASLGLRDHASIIGCFNIVSLARRFTRPSAKLRTEKGIRTPVAKPQCWKAPVLESRSLGNEFENETMVDFKEHAATASRRMLLHSETLSGGSSDSPLTASVSLRTWQVLA
ncbi:MAG: hypothetical protein JO216_01940 [Hyphomicrobiales bacterium]|nr:hypothetical protein [Hyphomicrobiales bacterium]